LHQWVAKNISNISICSIDQPELPGKAGQRARLIINPSIQKNGRRIARLITGATKQQEWKSWNLQNLIESTNHLILPMGVVAPAVPSAAPEALQFGSNLGHIGARLAARLLAPLHLLGQSYHGRFLSHAMLALCNHRPHPMQWQRCLQTCHRLQSQALSG
jgi:hypothetical protein